MTPLTGLTSALLVLLQGGTPPDHKLHPDPRFADYWHQGKAEITRFALEQSRYGEPRQGDAILVFVTEDFLPDKQVKSEGGDKNAQERAVPVLKLNLIRKFTTGIYDYSMMLSVFTPESPQAGPTLKVVASVQEWCGQVWLQLNRRDGKWQFTGHSYFEREADEQFALDGVTLEDELWTRIRIAPQSLPQGKVQLIPGAIDSRLRHIRPGVEAAQASLAAEDGWSRYTVRYASGRSLQIDFETDLPHRILAFEEAVPGPGGKTLLTRGTARERTLLDYWNRNGNDSAPLRKELGLK